MNTTADRPSFSLAFGVTQVAAITRATAGAGALGVTPRTHNGLASFGLPRLGEARLPVTTTFGSDIYTNPAR
jgi:hypothetical protein